MTTVEQDLSHAGSFLARFVEAPHYYSTLFDALGDGLGADSLERHTVEQQLLGWEIRNMVVVGGPKRTGEVKVERWADSGNVLDEVRPQIRVILFGIMSMGERKTIDLEQGWGFMQKGITKLKNILEGLPDPQEWFS